jgi:hypothetical protein
LLGFLAGFKRGTPRRQVISEVQGVIELQAGISQGREHIVKRVGVYIAGVEGLEGSKGGLELVALLAQALLELGLGFGRVG